MAAAAEMIAVVLHQLVLLLVELSVALPPSVWSYLPFFSSSSANASRHQRHKGRQRLQHTRPAWRHILPLALGLPVSHSLHQPRARPSSNPSQTPPRWNSNNTSSRATRNPPPPTGIRLLAPAYRSPAAPARGSKIKASRSSTQEHHIQANHTLPSHIQFKQPRANRIQGNRTQANYTPTTNCRCTILWGLQGIEPS